MTSSPKRKTRPLSSDDLFRTAKLACKQLRDHINGEAPLSAAKIEACKATVRVASKRSLYFFAKEVLGFDKMLPNPHKRWADELQAKWLEIDYFARLKPRGTFKTTLYGESFLLWVWACYSPRIRFFYTSANESLLNEVASHLDYFIGEKSESLYALVFGIRRDPTARQNTTEVFNIVGRDVAAKGSSLMFRTAGGATNGVHPHFIIIDDPCDRKDRESKATREAKTRWYDSLHPLLVPFELMLQLSNGQTVVKPIKKMMLVATRWHLNDLPSYIQKKSKKWHFEVEGVYAPDGKPAYPDLMPQAAIDAIQAEIAPVFFACQYLNNPLPEGAQVFVESRLKFLRAEQYDIKKGANYCFFDPSSGKDGSDYPAVIWVNVLNGRKVIFDAIDTRFPLTMLLAMIAGRNLEYRTRVMVFETNGAISIESSIKAAHQTPLHKAAGVLPQLIPVHETSNKEERIMASQPLLENGTWFFRADWAESHPEMRSQVIYYPAWGNDDFPDVIEKAVTHLTLNLPNLDRLRALNGNGPNA